jgi:ClpP class serine protease
MRFRYSKWTEQSQTDEQRLQQMVSLFSYLVVQTSGDVQEALDWLRQIAEEYGLFDENMSMDDLIDKLREMGIIERSLRRASSVFVRTRSKRSSRHSRNLRPAHMKRRTREAALTD